MSVYGTLRERLEKIYPMLPLSDRERTLAQWVLDGNRDDDILEDIRNSPVWWGEKAVIVAGVLTD